MQGFPMTKPETDDLPSAAAPQDSPKSILMNWILVALGCGGVAGLAALLPELM
jgi:hypothetical protein